MGKKVVKTNKVFEDGGPYSQAIIAGRLIFTSGQAAVNPKTRKAVEGSIEEQTRVALDNIKTILEEAGASLSDVVKVLIFLNDISDYEKANEVYREYFSENSPARTCVQAGCLEEGFLIEIEAIAVMPD